MNKLFYAAGHSTALQHAVSELKAASLPFADSLTRQVTHLLLPVPSFDGNGQLIGANPDAVFPCLNANTVIIGGRLSQPALSGYQTIDLLQDEDYVAANAAITAHCAIKEALQHMDRTFANCPVLIIGWGRIGKCLSKLLSGLEARVTIAARKSKDRAMATALGYTAIHTNKIDPSAYQVIFNTVPAPVLTENTPSLKIELASVNGMTGEDVIIARGLPNKYAPVSSGELIAQSVFRILYYNKEL